MLRVVVGSKSLLVSDLSECAAELTAAYARGERPEISPVEAAPVAPVAAPVAPVAPVFSTWTEQVSDDAAKARIEAQQAALTSAGIKVDASQQFYATGTRMAREGYVSQASRKAEHDAKMSVRDASAALRAAVESEGRRDETMSAREFARSLAVNGKITVSGYALSEQAIRGVASRLNSPMLSYVLGLRERIATECAKSEAERDRASIASDKAKIADILTHECNRAPDVALKLRTRKAQGDVFAVVSPSYAPADAPEVIAQLANELPGDARASWSYDPSSTAWELRASVWTPTPVEEQAVGEAFEGYASFQARDNGTARFRGGGGVTLIRCLNASTYTANDSRVSRVHRGTILFDIGTMLTGAVRAIDALCKAWGRNRETTIDVPSGLTIEDAIPGFWRHLLADRRSELAGVLPGRAEAHVGGLTHAFHGERRNHSELTRADFAQGWTKYIQGTPSHVRRDAEIAIGGWLMNDSARMAVREIGQ